MDYLSYNYIIYRLTIYYKPKSHHHHQYIVHIFNEKININSVPFKLQSKSIKLPIIMQEDIRRYRLLFGYAIHDFSPSLRQIFSWQEPSKIESLNVTQFFKTIFN